MIAMQPIAYVNSCFKEKFGIPRQPGLVDEAKGTLRLLPDYAHPDTVRGLEEFSHLWLIFMFHAIPAGEGSWKPTVRPPRLGGNARVGVFASRSMFRPNPLGLSVVRLEGVRLTKEGVELDLGGVDLLEGTPVLDIKPYLPYADSLDSAGGGFAPEAPVEEWEVAFSDLALSQCAQKSMLLQQDVRYLITKVLSLDPRPSYRKGQVDEHSYGVRLYDFDVRWCCQADKIQVIELVNV